MKSCFFSLMILIIANSVSASTLEIVENRQEIVDGSLFTVLRIKKNDSYGPNGFEAEIRYFGSIKKGADDPGVFKNKDETLIGVNFRPVVDKNEIYVIALNESGELIFVPNLNARIVSLLRNPSIKEDSLFLKQIDDDALIIESRPYGINATFRVYRIRFSIDEQLQLIAGK